MLLGFYVTLKTIDLFLSSDSFHNCISLVKAQTKYCNNDLLILNLKQSNKIYSLLSCLKALLDSQDKIKMYYGMSRVKNQPSGKRSIWRYCFLINTNLGQHMSISIQQNLSKFQRAFSCLLSYVFWIRFEAEPTA